MRPPTSQELAETARKLNKLRAEGKPARLEGLGDVVAKVTKAVGIKPCGGCKKRQEWLNKKVPFKCLHKYPEQID